MSIVAPNRELTESEHLALAEFLARTAGLVFDKSRRPALAGIVVDRIAATGAADLGAYLARISSPSGAEERQRLLDEVTIPETHFFRNPPQMHALRHRLLPELMRRAVARGRALTIWSDGCSSGEEPFTLAIQVHRVLGARLADWNVEIVATDISEKALEVALAGRYTEYAIRSTPGAVKARYFRPDGPSWSLDPAIRAMVTFETLNLKDRLGARRLGRFDVIFCRNVMIYFDDAMKAQVVGMFAEQLADDGTLFIGHSETLRGLDVPFEAFGPAQGFCYRKARTPAPRPGRAPAAPASAAFAPGALKLAGGGRPR